MYKRLIAVMLSGSLLGVSGLAQADDHRGHDRGRHEQRDKHHGHDRRDHDRHEWRGARHDHRDWRHERRGPPPRVVVERHYHQAPRYAPPRHYHRWSRGEYVPAPYRGGHYVVTDYRARHLAPPPRGSHWISVGSDYFLIGMATGMVLQSVLSQ
ncbi:Predicted integral membrane protein [Bordetella ansorpii]|uniref:Predicted integral membrane protein n=1 Tax=Bordetella ansorpii TaxID=288768 RepID=A0A157SC29_9BORD|nr:RcnB family protein [Bordetella ansorpii]SAI67992.1 Predicted integral membrane protein [Bordetella ansorpii]